MTELALLLKLVEKYGNQSGILFKIFSHSITLSRGKYLFDSSGARKRRFRIPHADVLDEFESPHAECRGIYRAFYLVSPFRRFQGFWSIFLLFLCFFIIFYKLLSWFSVVWTLIDNLWEIGPQLKNAGYYIDWVTEVGGINRWEWLINPVLL